VPRAYLASQYCNLHCNIATFLATSLQAIVAVEPCNARSPSGVARNADEIERAVTAPCRFCEWRPDRDVERSS
jgi:hypothetical protein